MLLWHDGMNYPAGSSFMAQQYPAAFTGISTGQQHPQPGKFGIATSNGVFQPSHAAPTGFGSEISTVGFWFNLDTVSTPTDGTLFMVWKDSSGSVKVQVRIRTQGDGFAFQIFAGDDPFNKTLLTSPYFPYRAWRFFEFQIQFSGSQGKVVVRADGVEASRAENVASDPNPSLGWNHVVFLMTASPAVYRMADLYILDGSGTQKRFKTFLGKISSAKLFPGVVDLSQSTWSPDPVNGGKTRGVIIAGQSNADGVSGPPYSGGWRSPNPFVHIWNTATNAWEPLEAGVNAWGHLYFPASVRLPWHGPNMQFAERVAQLYERIGSAPGVVKLFQLAVGASTVSPLGGAANGWHPSIPGSLVYQAVDQILAGVAAQGGISTFSGFDLFWYQGETETLLAEAVLPPFPYPFATWTLEVLQTIATALSPLPITLHLVRIHKDFPTPYADIKSKIRSIQEYLTAGNFIDVDELSTVDGAHLNSLGSNNLGNRIFDRWARSQDFAGLIRDELDLLSADSKWLGAAVGGKASIELLFPSRLDLVNSAILGTSVRGVVQSSAGETLVTPFGSIPLPTAGTFSPVRGISEKMMTPEQAGSPASIELA